MEKTLRRCGYSVEKRYAVAGTALIRRDGVTFSSDSMGKRYAVAGTTFIKRDGVTFSSDSVGKRF